MAYKDYEKQKEYQRQWVARRRAAWFATQECAWCDSTDRLELHHVDPNKKVGHAIWSWSQARRDAEIAKCIVLCRSCHHRGHAEARRIAAELTQGHGTLRCYHRGCRCQQCKTARRDAERAYKAAA